MPQISGPKIILFEGLLFKNFPHKLIKTCLIILFSKKQRIETAMSSISPVQRSTTVPEFLPQLYASENYCTAPPLIFIALNT